MNITVKIVNADGDVVEEVSVDQKSLKAFADFCDGCGYSLEMYAIPE